MSVSYSKQKMVNCIIYVHADEAEVHATKHDTVEELMIKQLETLLIEMPGMQYVCVHV